MPANRPPSVSLSAALARAIAEHLERNAEELEASHYCPRAGKVPEPNIRREIVRCRKWVKLLRGGRNRVLGVA